MADAITTQIALARSLARSKRIGAETQAPVTQAQLESLEDEFFILQKPGDPPTYLVDAGLWSANPLHAMQFPDAHKLWVAAHKLQISGLTILRAVTQADLDAQQALEDEENAHQRSIVAGRRQARMDRQAAHRAANEGTVGEKTAAGMISPSRAVPPLALPLEAPSSQPIPTTANTLTQAPPGGAPPVGPLDAPSSRAVPTPEPPPQGGHHARRRGRWNPPAGKP
jgi:hypothetical protein